jgi:Fe-S-cluster containining protein
MTNLSRNVDPDNCQKCGAQCCKVFEIWYGDFEPNVILSEMKRLQLLENVGKFVEIVRANPRRGYWLRFNDRCQYLAEDNSCMIHESDDRPLLCRLFPYPNSSKRDCPYISGRRKI